MKLKVRYAALLLIIFVVAACGKQGFQPPAIHGTSESSLEEESEQDRDLSSSGEDNLSDASSEDSPSSSGQGDAATTDEAGSESIERGKCYALGQTGCSTVFSSGQAKRV